MNRSLLSFFALHFCGYHSSISEVGLRPNGAVPRVSVDLKFMNDRPYLASYQAFRVKIDVLVALLISSEQNIHFWVDDIYLTPCGVGN